jgi:hypothetical protein
MRIPRFTMLQLLLAAALVALVLGLFTSSWRASAYQYIECVRFSPSGKYLAAKYGGGAVQVWRVDQGPPRRAALAFNRAFLGYDQSSIHFASDDRLLKLDLVSDPQGMATRVSALDLRSGETRELLRVPGYSYYESSLSHGGDRLAITDWNTGNLVIYNLSTGRPERTIAMQGSFWATAMSTDGRMLAMCDQASTVQVLDVESGQVGKLPLAGQMAVAISPDGNWVAAPVVPTQSAHQAITAVDLRTGKLQVVQARLTYAGWLSFSRDGSRLAAGDYYAIEVFDIAGGKRLSRIALDQPRLASAFPLTSINTGHDHFALSPDGQTLATFRGGQVLLLGATTGQLRHAITGGSRLVQIAIFTLGFALWAGAWGIVSKRERAKLSSRRIPAEQAASARSAGLSIPPAYKQGWSVMTWLLVTAGLLVLMVVWDDFSAQVAVESLAFVLLVLVGVCALAVLYGWLVRVAYGAHHFALRRLRQIAGDEGRLHELGRLQVWCAGRSYLEPAIQRSLHEVEQRAEELFGEPVGFNRPTLIAGLDEQSQLNAWFGYHMPVAAVVHNVRTANLGLVCEETALRQLANPPAAFRAVVALLLQIQHKRGALPGWVGSLISQRLVGDGDEGRPIAAAARRLRAVLARQPDWNPKKIFLRPERERSDLFLALDTPQARREVQAELDLLAVVSEMLLGDDAPAERRAAALRWLRKLRPKDDPLAAMSRELGLSLDELLAELRQWLAVQGTAAHEPMPPFQQQVLLSFLAPAVPNRSLPLELRWQAVQNIGLCGYVAAAEVLVAEVQDADSMLRREAIAALESLSGELYGDDPTRWQAWWESVPPEVKLPPLAFVAAALQQPEDALVARGASPSTAADERLPSVDARWNGPPPRALQVAWGLMIVGGLTALAIPITFLFLWGPFIFITLFYSLFLGVWAVARGASRETVGLSRVANMQAVNIIACDPVNPLLAAMEHALLRRQRVQEYLLYANAGGVASRSQ